MDRLRRCTLRVPASGRTQPGVYCLPDRARALLPSRRPRYRFAPYPGMLLGSVMSRGRLIQASFRRSVRQASDSGVVARAGRPVDALAEDIGVTAVASGLDDHVHEDPADVVAVPRDGLLDLVVQRSGGEDLT
jgi:hypothetical protein